MKSFSKGLQLDCCSKLSMGTILSTEYRVGENDGSSGISQFVHEPPNSGLHFLYSSPKAIAGDFGMSNA